MLKCNLFRKHILYHSVANAAYNVEQISTTVQCFKAGKRKAMQSMCSRAQSVRSLPSIWGIKPISEGGDDFSYFR